LKTVKSINDLPNPSETSISIITPPKITLQVLKDAKKIGIQYIWIQPGGEDKEVIDYVKDNSTDLNVVLGGPCILVEGPGLLKGRL
jgi:predicted CoA-binding protein